MIPGSMLFPWYGFALGSPLSSTALDSFNFAHGALVVTSGAVAWVVLREHSRPWPRPLSEGGLLIAGGVWCGLIIAFLAADPPDLLVGTAPIGGVALRYGIFVALGGAVAMVAGGMRARADAEVTERK